MKSIYVHEHWPTHQAFPRDFVDEDGKRAKKRDPQNSLDNSTRNACYAGHRNTVATAPYNVSLEID